MIPVLSRAQIRAFDARAMGVGGVPGIVLMENAGRGAAEHVFAELSPSVPRDPVARRVVVVCGTGNNGGDGFVLARHLRTRGVIAAVFLCGSIDKCTGDARTNCDAFVGTGGSVHLVSDLRDVDRLRASLRQAEVIVDALFGTGLDRPITGLVAEVVAAFNDTRCRRIALDIPSGLDADRGSPLGPAVRAHLTLTFAFPKLGLLTPRGLTHTGELRVVGIGVPAEVPPEVGKSADCIERADVKRWLLPRNVAAHKFSAGHVTVLAGSPGKTGAALLTARAALRSGAGAVTLATWPAVLPTVEARVPEVMCVPIADDLRAVDELLQRSRAVVVGPGLGLDEAARELLRRILAAAPCPVVLDADAITLVARHPDLLPGGGQFILTPHAGELARLLGVTSDDVEGDRFESARRAASETGAVVLLKGPHTVVADGARLLVADRGTPALATAGSGDVLAGILGALACSLKPLECAATGAWVHAHAGARAAQGDRGLLAGDIIEHVPATLADLLA